MTKKGLFTVLVLSILCMFTIQSFAALHESKITFDDESEGTLITEIVDFLDEWDIHLGIPTAGATVEVDGDNKFITTDSYLDFRTWDYIDSPYTFSIDYKLAGAENDNVGFFVRGVHPISKINPKNSNVDQNFAYFEWDWYAENGGGNGGSGIGGSGICVTPKDAGILIRVKNWQPDGLNISSTGVTIAMPEGIDKDAFNTITFKDDGEKVEIFINETLLATVEMSEKGVYEEDEDDDNEYFKKAVVKDAEGNELFNIDNAKINALGSQVAVGNRNLNIHLDNLYLAYEVPDPTPTPEPTDTPEPTEEPTQAPKTSSPSSSDEEDGGSNLLFFAIIGGVAVVVVVGVVLFIASKKK